MSTAIVWLRRDLRLDDNRALLDARRNHDRVCIAFVLNPPLLQNRRMGAPIVASFLSALQALRAELRGLGSDLAVLQGDFAAELQHLCARVDARDVYFNEDYEPEAIARDEAVTHALQRAGITAHASLDHVYFGAGEIVQNDGAPYRVFTPYKRRWLDHRAAAPRLPHATAQNLERAVIAARALGETTAIPSVRELGFEQPEHVIDTGEIGARKRLLHFLRSGAAHYRERRNVPSIDGTSRLSPDLRAGTVGIRTCVEHAFARAAHADPEAAENIRTWIDELIWRDFYQMVLRTAPSVVDESFLTAARAIRWENSRADFDAWCNGRTGYPLVDAAMRQLDQTGWMHNRLRMIAASFLTKHLLIDWRWGELYFAQHLADADLAQNNGGWQWAASTGTDAVPYFRIFNPDAQRKQFDPEGLFIRRFVPEFETAAYPSPIVDHRFARERALRAFSEALRMRGR